MVKVVVVTIIGVVLAGSSLLVFRNTQKSHVTTFMQNTQSQANPSTVSDDPDQKADLIATDDVNTVDQVEATNLADDVALDSTQGN